MHFRSFLIQRGRRIVLVGGHDTFEMPDAASEIDVISSLVTFGYNAVGSRHLYLWLVKQNGQPWYVVLD